MKKVAILVLGLAVLVALGTTSFAAAPTAKSMSMKTTRTPYELRGKVLDTYKGWFEVQVVKAMRGVTLQAGEKIRINETAKTRFRDAGRFVPAGILKSGANVDVTGQVLREGSKVSYTAANVTLLK
jgi:hypothetical protein